MSFRLGYLAPVALLASTLAAHATPTVIDFNTLTQPQGSAFTTYTENGFTVTNSAGQYYISQYGGPNLFGSTDPNFASGGSTPSVTIKAANGGAFYFDSADLLDSTFLAHTVLPSAFTFTGFSKGSTVYSQTGSINTSGYYGTYASSSSKVAVTSLTISETGNDFGLDNIRVDPGVTTAVTPEPSSLILLGTGALGMAGAVRRRFPPRA